MRASQPSTSKARHNLTGGRADSLSPYQIEKLQRIAQLMRESEKQAEAYQLYLLSHGGLGLSIVENNARRTRKDIERTESRRQFLGELVTLPNRRKEKRDEGIED